MRISNDNINFKALGLVSKPLEAFYNSNATAPIFTIESGVTIGRSIQAKKRGGAKEATDRFIEQGVSAAIWIWGVQALKKTGEFIGKKILKEDLDFDIGYDFLRNPIKNNNISKKASGFKIANLLSSTALATYFIGFILPKISMNIAKKKSAQKDTRTFEVKSIDFNQFQNKTKKSYNNSFKGIRSFASVIENNSTARLFITDTGVIAGRCKNAKSKYRKIENLFRDISSIYFYLFSTGHIVGALDKVSSTVDINPKVLSGLVEMLKDKLNDTKLSASEFKRLALGEEIDSKTLEALDELFKDKRAIEISEFTKVFSQYQDKALEMSKLQPLYEGKSIISYKQAKDILSDSWVSNPKFLYETFKNATNGASADSKRFIKASELEKIRQTIDDFIIMLTKQEETIDFESIVKKANANIKKSFGFYAFATAVSIYALGVLIPKIQYAISRKLTNKDEFRE